MKPIVLLLCMFIGAHTCFSQDMMRMEDNLTTTFTLTKMMAINADTIKHKNPLGKDTTYYAMVTFGKRRFDIELYQSATQKLIWTFYSGLKSNEYFKKDPSSNSTAEVYSLSRITPGGKEKFKVSFLKGSFVTVNISYTSEKTGQAPENVMIGSCDL